MIKSIGKLLFFKKMTNQIDNYTYKTDEKFGNGGFGLVYLARKEGEKDGEKKLYVIKIPLENKMDPDKIFNFNNEIDILNILSKISGNIYTSILYGFKKFENVSCIRPYYVMDYFSRGTLLDYIFSGKLKEIHKKFIFKKIIISYQFLHKNGIFHLDAKPDNIMFDKKFTPIIIDFGFSQKRINESTTKTLIKGKVTSGPYSAPELGEGKEIDGEKADVFSLGAILFNLFTMRTGFLSAERTDPYYSSIMKKEYDNYWRDINIRAPENFRTLYQSMVAYKPDKRPNLEKILDNNYNDLLKEVSNLTEDEEKKIIGELEGIHEDIKNPKEINAEKRIKNENLITRANKSNKNIIFTDENLKPKKISKDRLILNQAINIIGNFSEVDYMNSLYRDIKNKFGKNSYFKTLENLTMEVIFEYEEEEEKKEKDEEKEENKDNKGVKEPIGDCQMLIELFEYEKGKYLLEFRRTGGKYADYYHHFLKIKEIITKKN